MPVKPGQQPESTAEWARLAGDGCLRELLDPQGGKPLVAPQDERARQQFCSVLFREGLLGLYCQQAVTADPQIPEDLRRRLREDVLRELVWKRLLDELEEALHQRGLTAVVLKGGAGLYGLYPAPGLRPLSDLDLLVRPEQLSAVIEAGESLGFASLGTSLPVFIREGWMVDLHTSPVNQLHRAFPLRLEEFWRDSLPLHEGSAALHQLRPEHALVVAILHASKHSFQRSLWLLDIALLLRKCEPGQARRALAEARAQRYLVYADYLLRRRGLPGIAPEFRLWKVERAYLNACSDGVVPEFLGMLIPLLSIPDWRERLSYLGSALFPEGFGWSRLGRLSQLFGRGLRFLTTRRSDKGNLAWSGKSSQSNAGGIYAQDHRR